jgi:hypothetical protein
MKKVTKNLSLPKQLGIIYEKVKSSEFLHGELQKETIRMSFSTELKRMYVSYGEIETIAKHVPRPKNNAWKAKVRYNLNKIGLVYDKKTLMHYTLKELL